MAAEETTKKYLNKALSENEYYYVQDLEAKSNAVTTKYCLQWLCGWQDSCQSRLCNFVQFGLAKNN